MEIIPAILPKDFAELQDKIEQVRGIVPVVQVDICDGHFTPNATWPYRKHDENFEAILREERGLPAWEDVEYEFDLMVKTPEKDIENWVKAGAARVIIHLGTITSPEQLDGIIRELTGLVEIGVAVRAGNSLEHIVEKIGKHIANISFIQCMGIDRIGFQGQGFDTRVVDQVRALRTHFNKETYPHLRIGVDGGVNLETAALLKDADADRLVVGSAIFATDNIVEAIHNFENI